MKKFFLILLTIFISSCLYKAYSEDWTLLIGKTIILPYKDATLSPYVYSEDVLPKFKFKNSNLAEESIVNIPLTVEDVIVLNASDKVKRNINFILSDGNKKYILHFVLSCPYGERQPFYLNGGLFNFNNKLTYANSPENISLSYYDVSLIDEINSRYAGYIVEGNTFLSVRFDANSRRCYAVFTSNSGENIEKRLNSNKALNNLIEELKRGTKIETPIQQTEDVIRL